MEFVNNVFIGGRVKMKLRGRYQSKWL